MFCTIKGANVSGLIHKSKLPKEKRPFKNFFKKGEPIELQVLKIDGTKMSFCLGENAGEDKIGHIEAMNFLEDEEKEDEEMESDSSDDESEEDMEIDDVPELQMN